MAVNYRDAIELVRNGEHMARATWFNNGAKFIKRNRRRSIVVVDGEMAEVKYQATDEDKEAADWDLTRSLATNV